MNSARPSHRVRIVQESYIPVARVQLVEALLREIDQPDERQRFESFCRLIEAIYHFE